MATFKVTGPLCYFVLNRLALLATLSRRQQVSSDALSLSERMIKAVSREREHRQSSVQQIQVFKGKSFKRQGIMETRIKEWSGRRADSAFGYWKKCHQYLRYWQQCHDSSRSNSRVLVAKNRGKIRGIKEGRVPQCKECHLLLLFLPKLKWFLIASLP